MRSFNSSISEFMTYLMNRFAVARINVAYMFQIGMMIFLWIQQMNIARIETQKFIQHLENNMNVHFIWESDNLLKWISIREY